MAKITQALVLVGGKASRLRAGGVDVELSKAFIPVAGHPLLFWNLYFLHKAGIRRLVIAADKTILLHHASKVLSSLPVKFSNVHYFQDEGNGVHGIPYELRYLLDEAYVFECGHSFSAPDHYKHLMESKAEGNVVFSAYTAHPKNPRQPVSLDNGLVHQTPNNKHSAIAHPIIADQKYAENLLWLDFNVRNIISHYSNADALRYVDNELPAECDIVEEFDEAINIYEHYIAKFATIQP